VFAPGRAFQLSEMFGSKVGAYLIETPIGCYTLGLAPGLTHKLSTRQEKLARDKYSSLLRTLVNNSLEKYSNIG
jgi:hypothetical protein